MKTLAYFDELATNLDRWAWNVGTAPWADWAWKIVEQHIGDGKDKLIVDLGTGTGSGILNIARHSHGARFLGVDFSKQMIEVARAKKYPCPDPSQVRFLVSRLDRLRLPDSSVDYFVSCGTFHHVKNKAHLITRLFHMLKANGEFLNLDQFEISPRYRRECERLRASQPELTAENDRVRERFQWIYDQDRNHPIEFKVDPYRFQELLEQAGFVDCRVHNSLQPGFAVVLGRKPRTER